VLEERVPQPFVWVDLEMTGTDIEKDRIVEVSCVITDGTPNLTLVAEHETMAIAYPDSEKITYNPWSADQHAKSGLLRDIKERGIPLKEAESRLTAFMQRFVENPRNAYIAGNSVHFDKLFIQKYMPLFDQFFVHRIIDVSTMSELAKRWNNEAFVKRPRKLLQHRARIDIYESIRELKYFKRSFSVLRRMGK